MPRKPSAPESVPVERIAGEILLLRGQRVMLDADLAALYGVAVKRLNEQVRRNSARFPSDFMFQLTDAEVSALRTQIATIKKGRGQHRKYLPFAFTEHGAIMAATVLNSREAVEMSVFVVRAFVRLRELLSSSKALAQKLAELEARLEGRPARKTMTLGPSSKCIRRQRCFPRRVNSRRRTGPLPRACSALRRSSPDGRVLLLRDRSRGGPSRPAPSAAGCAC